MTSDSDIDISHADSSWSYLKFELLQGGLQGHRSKFMVVGGDKSSVTAGLADRDIGNV